MEIKHIGLYANNRQKDVIELCTVVIERLKEKAAVYVPETADLESSFAVRLSEADFRSRIDLLLVIGGDGTFLRAAGIVGDSGIPMLGINKGHLGFLSELEEDDFFKAVDVILSGDFNIEPRMRIEATVTRNGQILGDAVGLNDLVVNRNALETTISCDVYMGDALIDRYNGDGLIIATPTGSTGYSLSAGGPLIYPGTDCLIVNPICSHFLGTRAVIVPPSAGIDVVVTRSGETCHLIADGLSAFILKEGDRIHVSRADVDINLVHVRKHPFFEAVRNKLLSRDYRKL